MILSVYVYCIDDKLWAKSEHIASMQQKKLSACVWCDFRYYFMRPNSDDCQCKIVCNSFRVATTILILNASKVIRRQFMGVESERKINAISLVFDFGRPPDAFHFWIHSLSRSLVRVWHKHMAHIYALIYTN